MSALDFLQSDLAPLLAVLLAGGLCGLLGSFLVLRRDSLIADALSHAVLPGIILGFAISGARSGLPMVGGAMLAALAAVALIGVLIRSARLDPAAATGAVFTVFFALGLVLIETTGARDVDLDLDCVLFGQVETLVWTAATGWSSLLDPAALAQLPRQLFTLAAITLAAGLFVATHWRPLAALCFDRAHAEALGLPVRRLETALMLMVAAAAVGAFEAVGSILVVALLVCPAVALRLLTDRYAMQVLGGAALGAGLAGLGYFVAAPLPLWLGASVSISAAGAIGALGGLAVALCALGRALRLRAPSRGGVRPASPRAA
jgi:manganese/zinc/iron transport system permease protein